MKISKIIFISYFSIVGLVLLSLMVMGFAFNNVDYKKIKGEHFETLSEDLESFNHLYVEKSCNVTLKSGDKYNISHMKDKRKESPKPEYEVRNDTLFVKSTANNVNCWVTVHAENIQSIHGDTCSVTLNSLKQPSIAIDLNKSRLRFSRDVKVSSLDLTLKENSNFNGWDFEAGNIKMNILNSRFQGSTKGKLDVLEGNISNKSNVRLPKAKRIQLDVDETSEVKMY